MKTCLYQPIFINPQAYFVFPSLYNIEKGDSFIEPANITGQLIINTLTDDPTLTPIILTVKDNNQVDFSIFAGKHIRISQYTDEDAVVLGEWYIPGTPEPEYPDWFKDSVIALYDPASQGMTNYDVIEAYVEDFTYWTLDNTGITSTPKKIVIPAGTELKYIIAYRGFNSFTDGFDIKYTGNVVITYRYNKEDGTVGTIAIDKSGIYHLPASVRAQKNFGFYCNPQTVTEEATIEQLPTSILKDLSGNGNHAYLYGGKGKLNSGMGVYNEDFLTFMVQGGINSPNATFYSNKVIIDNIKGKTNFWKDINNAPIGKVTYPSYKIRVSGLPENSNIKIEIRHGDDYSQVINIYAINNEIITIPEVTANVITPNKNYNYFNLVLYSIESIITIEQIPDYPDQLCYDGKMYAVCYGFPILTDYTVMAERTWFDKEEYSAFVSNSLGGMEDPSNGAFSVEVKSLDSFTVMSFGSLISISTPKKGITYQTKQSYNGNSINVGTKESNEILILGGRYFYKNGNVAGNTWTGCHGAIIVADRSFTEEEINWLKENIYNIEI